MKHEHFWVMCAAASTALVVIAGAAGAALAEPVPVTVVGHRSSDDGMSVRVSYHDLNLAAARDERTLKRRVGGAARFVCEPNGSDYHSGSDYSDCVSYAWDGARPQIAAAVQRARDIALTGTSSIPMVAISISVR